jgi:alpha-tubulin suppressor-like RCC1 family protein
MSAGGEGTIGAGTSESSAAAGCSLSERLRPSSSQKTNTFARRTLPDLDGLAVFTWGRGEDGQLGLGDTSDQDEPTYVDALRGVGVRQIACGSGHTVVLTTDGEVYTWVSRRQLSCQSKGGVAVISCYYV